MRRSYVLLFFVRIFSTLAALTVISACAASAVTTPLSTSTNSAAAKLKVVSTVSPLVNLIYNVGGDRIQLSGIIPEGTDSHTFEPAPSDVQKLAQADLIFVNGLSLEDPTKKLAKASIKTDAEIIELAPLTISENEYVYDFSFPKESGKPNPHLWTDPTKALRYAEIARDALVRRDPQNANYYNKNFAAFKERIDKLDAAIRTSVATIPAKNRKLLTYHDSFPFFGPRYGFEIIGAIQPNDFGEPSPKQVADLILQIRQVGVPAIFGSEVFPSPILEQIAKESGAKFVDAIRDDDLPGKPGDPAHSYLQMIVDDVIAITEALGGNSSVMKTVDTTNVPGVDASVNQPQ